MHMYPVLCQTNLNLLLPLRASYSQATGIAFAIIILTLTQLFMTVLQIKPHNVLPPTFLPLAPHNKVLKKTRNLCCNVLGQTRLPQAVHSRAQKPSCRVRAPMRVDEVALQPRIDSTRRLQTPSLELDDSVSLCFMPECASGKLRKAGYSATYFVVLCT